MKVIRRIIEKEQSHSIYGLSILDGKKRPNLEENPQQIVTVAASFMRNKIKYILSLNRYIKLHSISVIVFDYGT